MADEYLIFKELFDEFKTHLKALFYIRHTHERLAMLMPCFSW